MSTDDFDRVLEQAHALKAAGRFEEALRMVSPIARAAREGSDIVMGLRATLVESLLLSVTGQEELSLARSTWALSAASSPRVQQVADAEREDDSVWEVTMAFLRWVNAAGWNERIPLETTFAVIEAGQRFVESIGLPEWRCGLLSERSGILRRLHRYREAETCCREALELKRRHPRAPSHTEATMMRSLAGLLYKLEEYDEAAQVCHQVLALSAAHGLDELAALIWLGRIALAGNAVAEAAGHADEALTLARTLGPKQEDVAAGFAVEAYLAADRLEDARAAADIVMHWAVRNPSPTNWRCAYQDAVDVALAEGNAETARRMLEAMARYATLVDQRSGTTEAGDAIEERRARLASLEERVLVRSRGLPD